MTEHGNVETENEIYELKGYDYDTKFWSHHHNPRTVANNPAGEISLNMGITGPHYTIGAACAAGNAGMIQGAQMLRLGECDVALAGGVSESIHTFGIFASFKSQGALATHDDPTKASRPFDVDRNGIVVAEGGCLYVLERFDDAKRRGAKIYGELVGYAMNSDASDFVLPNPARQAECMQLALQRARLDAERDRHRQHARHRHRQRRRAGVRGAAAGVRRVAADTLFNNTKSFIGHAMGAAGALELAGNLPAFDDGVCHATINVDRLDPECALAGPGRSTSRARAKRVDVHPEQLIRYAGDQFGRDRQTQFERTRGEATGMTPAEIKEVILDILADIAPDEDLSGLKDDVPLREQLELDSMDFLDIVMELRKRYRVQIPEDDYMQPGEHEQHGRRTWRR